MSYKEKEQHGGTIAVVMATMLDPNALKAVEKIHAAIDHLPSGGMLYIFIDAVDLTPEQEAVRDALDRECENILWLNENTGAGGYFGHRIYGAAPFLVNGCDYISWCDEDNLVTSLHYCYLLSLARENELGFAYSLRSIIDEDDNVVCQDNCESLGHWPPYTGAPNLIDVSCMFMPVRTAVQLAPLWYARAHVAGDCPPDRGLAKVLLDAARRIDPDPMAYCTGRHSLGYRMGGGSDLPLDFWATGNERMRAKYGEALPWIK